MFISNIKLPEAKEVSESTIKELIVPMQGRLFDVVGLKDPGLRAETALLIDKLANHGADRFKRDFRATILNKWELDKKELERVAYTLFCNSNTMFYALLKYIQKRRLTKFFPYWHYKAGHPVDCPHSEMNGVMLPPDDPWWQTHYPPNGINCTCYVQALDEVDIKHYGLEATTQPPTLEFSPEWVYICTGEGAF